MEYIVKCKKCGKEYKVICSQKQYDNNKYNHYCSYSCRNSHYVSNETRQKISNAFKSKKQNKENFGICKCCGNLYIKNGKENFCSNECKNIFRKIPTFIKYFGLDENVIGTIDIFNEIEKIKYNLYKDYWIDELTSDDICKKYNYPSACNLIGKIFKYLNIETRNNSQATLLNYINEKIGSIDINNKYKTQWHTTWNNKEVFLRSSYELDYAKELDEQKVNYDVECLRIKYWNTKLNEYHCAIPDFYLIDTNTIVEIKSSWTLDIQQMKDKMNAYKEQGYNCKLICDHQEIEI